MVSEKEEEELVVMKKRVPYVVQRTHFANFFLKKSLMVRIHEGAETKETWFL